MSMMESKREEILSDIRDGYIDEWDNLTIDELFKQIESEHNEIQQYRAIGTVSEFRELKEKATAKKPKMIGYRKDGEPVYECGCCGSTLAFADQRFCMMCSCQVDWSEGKER